MHFAINAYKGSLIYNTPHAAPLAYATTQNSLGFAYAQLALIENQKSNLLQAIDTFKAALIHQTPKTATFEYAITHNNLANAYSDLANHEDEEGNLQRALVSYQESLIYVTPTNAPLDYAMAQTNMGLTLWKLGNKAEACKALTEGEKYYRYIGDIEYADIIAGNIRRNCPPS